MAGNTLMVLLAALILVAVGDELVISHPLEHPEVATVQFLYGGPALFLAGQAVFIQRVLGRVPRSRLVGVGALVLLAGVSFLVPAFVAAIGAALPLIGVAVADALVHRWS